MKKLALILLITFCATSVFASGGTDSGSAEREVYKVKFFGWENVPQENVQKSLDFVKEKFGLDMDIQSLAGMHNPAGMNKPELIWASGDYPHFFEFYYQRIEDWNYPGIWDKIMDWRPHIDKVPNVRSRFTDFEWNDMVQRRSLPNGKLPYLPGHNYRIANTAWAYEKNTFDNLGIDAPLTLDDLYRALQVLRAEYPDPEYFLIGGRRSFSTSLSGSASHTDSIRASASAPTPSPLGTPTTSIPTQVS